MVAYMIDQFGNEEQKKRYIPQLCQFDISSSYLLTEPDSGSDAQAMKSTAVDKGNGYYVVNGTKQFISGAGHTDLLITMCKTGEKEVSCFIVENGAEGLSFGKNEAKVIIIEG